MITRTQAQPARKRLRRVSSSPLTCPTARQIYFSGLPADSREQEERERIFYGSLRLRNGTYKTTYPHRLDDLNELCNPLLPSQRPLRIMDVAVSSGVSTLEWMVSLENAGIEHHMTAGDFTLHAFLISVGRHFHVLLDRTGYPLQFELCGVAFGNPPSRRKPFRYSPPLFERLAKLLLVSRVPWPPPDSACQLPIGSARLTCRPVDLASTRLRERPHLCLAEDDILVERQYSQRFHVLRAANILNRSYFSDDTLRKMLANLRSRLVPSGILIVCRTDKWSGVNHATLFELSQRGQLEVAARLGSGSDIEDLVLALPGGPVA